MSGDDSFRAMPDAWGDSIPPGQSCVDQTDQEMRERKIMAMFVPFFCWRNAQNRARLRDDC